MSFCIILLFPPLLSSTYLTQQQTVPAVASAPTTTGTTNLTGLIFMALIPLLPRTGSKVINSSLDALLLVDNGLLTDLLSNTSSVSYDSPSATQPCNVLSFATVVISPLHILLLVWFLPLLGSWTPVRTNTLCLIL